MSAVIVRGFEARDVAPANALTNRYIVETTVHFALDPARDEDFEAMWRSGSARFPWLAAELDGAFAGYCKAGVWRERAAYACTVETGVYVCDHAHRRGVGRALYTALFDALVAGGWRVAVAGITLPNEASVRLHESVGFRAVGVFHGVGEKFGARHDVGFWERELQSVEASRRTGSS